MRDDILDLKSAKRIAVMGGTFDPIHYGHLVTAEAVRHEYKVERVIFIPTGQPSYKNAKSVTHSEHRYLMTVLATVTNPAFDVSRIEIDREGATYTIDTIKHLRNLCGAQTKIYFITGADAVLQILSWKNADELLTLCSFVAVTRPGYNPAVLREHVQRIKQKYATRLHFLEVPALAISSSDIRTRIGQNKPVRYLLPEEVERYILKSGLYRTVQDGDLLATIDAYVKAHQSPKRYAHTAGVAAAAARLAALHHADEHKAKLAGWLHDCTRHLSDAEAKKLCKSNGVKPDEIMKQLPYLLHGYTAAIIAAKNFDVHDTDVLNAVRYHTTGRVGMSLLEKIVLLADKIEPNREEYPGLADIRALAETDLDAALAMFMELNIEYEKTKHSTFHPLAEDALRDIRKTIKNRTEENK